MREELFNLLDLIWPNTPCLATSLHKLDGHFVINLSVRAGCLKDTLSKYLRE